MDTHKDGPNRLGLLGPPNRFGGEGTGAHCGGQVEMLPGREYTFHIEVSRGLQLQSLWRIPTAAVS